MDPTTPVSLYAALSVGGYALLVWGARSLRVLPFLGAIPLLTGSIVVARDLPEFVPPISAAMAAIVALVLMPRYAMRREYALRRHAAGKPAAREAERHSVTAMDARGRKPDPES